MTSLVVIGREARTLEEIAASIRANHDRGTEALFAIGRDLAEARRQLPLDRDFGRWMREEGFPFSQQWAHVLRTAAENEPAVRRVLTTQVVGNRKPNLKKAVRTALGLPDRIPTKEAKPIGAPWVALTELMDSLGQMVTKYDAHTIAMAVPARRRGSTAKRLRSMGTDLGRVALMIERLEDEP